MVKKPSNEELQRKADDYFARRLAFLTQVWEADREHKIEFYKQIMILSVAGLGFSLTTPIRNGKKFDWWPDTAWEVSIYGFFFAIIFTLILFYARSSLYSLLSKLVNPDFEHGDSVEENAGILQKVNVVLTVLITISFTIAVIGTIISIT